MFKTQQFPVLDVFDWVQSPVFSSVPDDETAELKTSGGKSAKKMRTDPLNSQSVTHLQASLNAMGKSDTHLQASLNTMGYKSVTCLQASLSAMCKSVTHLQASLYADRPP